MKKEIKIVRIVKEKQEEKKYLIEIRIVEKIVLRRFYKYLKVFKKRVRKNANEEDMALYYRSQRQIYTKKGEDIFIVQNRKRGDIGVLERSVEEELYLTIKVIIDITGVFCMKER